MPRLLGVEQELTAPVGALRPLPTFADVVFQCPFDGPNGAQFATDESLIHAPLSFDGQARIVTDGHLGINSLRCDFPEDFVSAPHNDAYDQIGQGDFTIEFWFASSQTTASNPTQYVGVWEPGGPAMQHWRVISDGEAGYLDYMQGGIWKRASLGYFWAPHVYRLTRICRVGNTLTRYLTSRALFHAELVGAFDIPAGLARKPRLTIGGCVTADLPLNMIGNMQSVRITDGAWYRTDAEIIAGVPVEPFNYLDPGLFVDADIFRVPSMGAERFVDQDVIYSASVAFTAGVTTLFPSSVADVADDFFVPVPFTGPHEPRVIGGGGYPMFLDAAVTSGIGTASATLDLPTTRNPGEWLLALLYTEDGPKTFDTVGYDESPNAPDYVNYLAWQPNRYPPIIGQQGPTGVPAACGKSFWAWRYVDGLEESPTFNWTGGTNWRGYVLRFSIVGGGKLPLDVFGYGNPFSATNASGHNNACGIGGTLAENAPAAFVPNFPAGTPIDSKFRGVATSGGHSYGLTVTPPSMGFTPEGLYLCILQLSNDQIIAAPPRYNTLYSYHDSGGSLYVFGCNAVELFTAEWSYIFPQWTGIYRFFDWDTSGSFSFTIEPADWNVHLMCIKSSSVKLDHDFVYPLYFQFPDDQDFFPFPFINIEGAIRHEAFVVDFDAFYEEGFWEPTVSLMTLTPNRHADLDKIPPSGFGGPKVVQL